MNNPFFVPARTKVFMKNSLGSENLYHTRAFLQTENTAISLSQQKGEGDGRQPANLKDPKRQGFPGIGAPAFHRAPGEQVGPRALPGFRVRQDFEPPDAPTNANSWRGRSETNLCGGDLRTGLKPQLGMGESPGMHFHNRALCFSSSDALVGLACVTFK